MAVPDRLEKNRSALVVIDVQERFRDIIVDMKEVVNGCSRLIRFCDHLQIPILVTEHYPKGLGVTLSEVRSQIGSFDPLEKITFSCADDDGFNTALASLQRDQIIVCGIESHVCVYQTVRDLLANGRQVAVAADAVSARTAFGRRIGLQRMQELGCQNMSAEMIMFEILRKAKTDDFQLVSRILKEL